MNYTDLPASTLMQRLRVNVAGNIMPMAAIAMVAMAGLVGGGVDMSRAYMAQNRLQNACDSAVLAGRKAVGSTGYETAEKAEADRYFETNFDPSQQDVATTTFTSVSPDGGDTVNGTASTEMNTAVMQLFGYDSIALSASCTASMSVGNNDVMLVLDVTGSMACTSAMTDTQCTDYINSNGYSETAHGGDSRLKELQAAMKAFYTTTSTAAAGGNGRVRYGFVPYSSSVNVGKLIYAANANYLVDSHDYETREPKTKTTTETGDEVIGYEEPYPDSDEGYGNRTSGNWNLYNYSNYRYNSWCNNNLPSDTPWTNSGSEETFGPETYTDGNNRRITRTTTRQKQTRTDYKCFYYSGNRRYYRWYRSQERFYYEYNYQIEDPIYETITTTEFSHFLYRERPLNTSVYKTGVAVTQPNGTDGANVPYTWKGCIEEVDTVAQATYSYNSVTGLDPAGALDLDINHVPGSDDSTKWRPLWEGMTYYRVEWISTGGGNGYYDLTDASETQIGGTASSFCPDEAQLLTEMTQEAFDLYADNLEPAGSTYHDIGMLWGARMSSPDGIFASNVNAASSNNGQVARHIVFMTDGVMSSSITSNSPYGIEYHDRRVTDDGVNDGNSRHTERFLAVCQQAKAEGIRVWVIAFAVVDSGLGGETDGDVPDDLVECASPQSAFAAKNATQLNNAFQDIGQTIGELRVVQ